jgi:hypothetical protein
MAELIGALLITYILTRAVNSIAKKRTNPAKAALITFLVVATVALGVTSLTVGVGKGLIMYIPCLLLWLIVDVVRAKKVSVRDQGISSFKGEANKPRHERPKIPACKHCGAEYDPKDYRQDALEWLCPHCRKALTKI